MKKIIYLSIALSSFAFSGIALANNELDNMEFKYLVCGYLEDSETMQEAISNIEAVIEDLDMTNSQEEILEDLEDEEFNSESYCTGLEY